MHVRLAQLQQRLRLHGLDGAVITHPVDLYYFTQTMQAGMLFVSAVDTPHLFIRRCFARACKETTVALSAFTGMTDLRMQMGALYPQLRGNSTQMWGVTYDTITLDLFRRLEQNFPQIVWHDATVHVRTLRMVKDEQALCAMRRAAHMVDEALRIAWAQVTPQMTEIALMAQIEYALRCRGHLGIMRARGANMDIVTGIVSGGEAAAQPSAFYGPVGGAGLHPAFPKGASTRPLGTGSPIVLDIGANVDGYLIDQTRIGIIGPWEDDDLRRAYDVAVDILQHIEQRLAPGNSAHALYALSVELASQAGLAQHFMGEGRDTVSFVGHGFGLEIDEWPVLAPKDTTTLQPGMVLAIEPKFVFAQRGVVGIENAYVITDTGYEKLTISHEGIWTA